jgi:hypothetical protein
LQLRVGQRNHAPDDSEIDTEVCNTSERLLRRPAESHQTHEYEKYCN